MLKLEYPLLALVTLTEDECNFTLAPVLKSGLPMAGICRNMPRADVYGDATHQGMGLHNLYTAMGIIKIQALVDNIWSDSTTGKLLQTSVETMKGELDTQGSIFKLDCKIYGHLATDCWVKYLLYFVYKNKIEIGDHVDEGPLLREKDSMLPKKFAIAEKRKLINRKEWEIANRCRLYLQVLSIVDIATGDGQAIDINVRKGLS